MKPYNYISFLFSMTRAAGCIFMALLINSCHRTDVPFMKEEQQYPSDSTFRFLNLSYGDDPLNKLDLYLPAGRDKNTAVIILIHGGGWIAGDKNMYNSTAEDLLKDKFIVANINYRFVSATNNYTGLMKDLGDAISFLKNENEKYGIEQNKFHLQGYSAGGHMALLYAYTNNDTDIGTVVSFSGPTNINNAYLKRIIITGWLAPQLPGWLLGENFSLNSWKAKDCSPIYKIKDIPVLFIHGTDDDTVPYRQSVLFNDSLNAKGIKHLFISVPGGTHYSLGPDHVFYYDSIIKTINNWTRQNP